MDDDYVDLESLRTNARLSLKFIILALLRMFDETDETTAYERVLQRDGFDIGHELHVDGTVSYTGALLDIRMSIYRGDVSIQVDEELRMFFRQLSDDEPAQALCISDVVSNTLAVDKVFLEAAIAIARIAGFRHLHMLDNYYYSRELDQRYVDVVKMCAMPLWFYELVDGREPWISRKARPVATATLPPVVDAARRLLEQPYKPYPISVEDTMRQISGGVNQIQSRIRQELGDNTDYDVWIRDDAVESINIIDTILSYKMKFEETLDAARTYTNRQAVSRLMMFTHHLPDDLYDNANYIWGAKNFIIGRLIMGPLFESMRDAMFEISIKAPSRSALPIPESERMSRRDR